MEIEALETEEHWLSAHSKFKTEKDLLNPKLNANSK